MPLAINVSSEPYPVSGLSSAQLLHPYSVFTTFALRSAFIKLCFLYACIDMDSYDVVYLSSDDESPFDRNQRVLKEYHEEEDRRRVQSHLT